MRDARILGDEDLPRSESPAFSRASSGHDLEALPHADSPIDARKAASLGLSPKFYVSVMEQAPPPSIRSHSPQSDSQSPRRRIICTSDERDYSPKLWMADVTASPINPPRSSLLSEQNSSHSPRRPLRHKGTTAMSPLCESSTVISPLEVPDLNETPAQGQEACDPKRTACPCALASSRPPP